MKKFNCINDPSLDHLNAKIIAWLLSMVLIGLVLGTALANYQEKQWRTFRLRTTRSVAIRTTKRKGP